MNGQTVVVDKVDKSYTTPRGQTIHAVDQVSFTLEEGEFVCLLGPSGCGKSTILNVIAGFESATGGRCTMDGRPVDGPGPDRGVVFQEYGVLPWMSVRANVEFGLKIKGNSRSERDQMTEKVLDIVGLRGFESEYPRSLSGGMKQRVAIARVLALKPRVLLMDEPFGALDALTRSSLQRELESAWLDERPAVVFVTHNVEESVLLGDRVIVMSAHPGRVKEIVDVPLDRPRQPADQRFGELREYLTKLIMATEVDPPSDTSGRSGL